ncbi:ABC transporter ATP-binding protein [Mycoplasma putrefaciens]|uniref:ABC transporter, ATP-binding/permease protein n=1 Tax=Mycoplasma putrefaciens (strain ATCC 15718 / NCTC 10155 / C30 KS-1 / KS-1) TaxID=743965 RepID=A0A7U4E9N4_MYCPK|nr:ABC transporter B family permease/ATP-binding protein [Mycoplasma putrefaciens]AEM68729.1 ABC transporter, ATP-binding/permease protein [Mycoplasma putrefaciens KS1]
MKKIFKSVKNKLAFDNERKFTIKKLGMFFKMNVELAKKSPLLFWSCVLATSFDAFFSTILPLFSAKMLDALLTGQKTSLFNSIFLDQYGWLAVVGVNLLIIIVLEYLTNFTITLYSAQIEVMQRVKILNALADQDVDFYFDHVSGNILTRLVADTQNISFGVQQFITNFIYSITASITAIVIMFTQHQELVATVALAYLLIVNILGVVLFVDMRRKMIISFDRKREIDADMTDRINNISLIKASGTEEYEIKRLEQKDKYYEESLTKVNYSSAVLNTWLIFSIRLLMPIIFIIFTFQFLNGTITAQSLGTNTALVFPLLSTLIGAISILLPSLRTATAASNAADRISELTEPVPSIHPNKDGYKISKIDKITFDKVSFAYPKKPDRIVLPEMSLTFEKGKSYAFVGQTGAGKSTIAKLLLRFYMPTSGKILINNKHDLNKINLPAYLDKVGYVEQDPQILFGTFFENIRYSKFDATDQEIIQACKKAELHDFIMSLPDQYNTVLGQRGFILSGGQKQRLVIARVFLKNPDLIILDEATSALDNVVEKEIQKKLDELIKGRMCITIAHRLTTIKNVDQIYVLGPNGAGIVQQGTFNELKKQPGHFRNLYEAGLME